MASTRKSSIASRLLVIGAICIILGLALVGAGGVIDRWSADRQAARAEAEFARVCPNYPDSNLTARGIADDCGNGLFQKTGIESIIARTSTGLLIVTGLALITTAAIRNKNLN